VFVANISNWTTIPQTQCFRPNRGEKLKETAVLLFIYFFFLIASSTRPLLTNEQFVNNLLIDAEVLRGHFTVVTESECGVIC